MPSPAQIKIHTSALQRLAKEEVTYRKELVAEEENLKKLEEKFQLEGPGEDGNAEYMIKQLKTSIEQTKDVFAPLKQKIQTAKEKLEDLVDNAEKTGGASEEEVQNAKAAIESVSN